MGNDKDLDLREHLKALETSLLQNATRKIAELVGSLLADEFREFGSSGRVYLKADIVLALQEEATVCMSMIDFEMRVMAPAAVLLTYRSVKTEPDGTLTQALRSSIWIGEGEDWQMLFHQGTKLAA